VNLRVATGSFVCLLLATGCGGSLLVDSEGTGETGGSGSGGVSATGSVPTSGGVASGGAPGGGGVTDRDGSSTGGEVGSGGAIGTGGEIATGGDTASGGSPGSGGISSGGAPTGGVFGAGGAGSADAGHCFDGKRDSTESDVDCGGECAGCGPGLVCYFDSDCSATAPGCDQCTCDVYTSTCVQSHCYDHKKDGNETAIDCGGVTCNGCANNLACNVDTDCASQACNSATGLCTSNPCADAHQDGTETDIDCGGITCLSCPPGFKCQRSLDCLSGHFCNSQNVCQ
jgi:hypothetical protein